MNAFIALLFLCDTLFVRKSVQKVCRKNFYLVRHGEYEALGFDGPLTPRGRDEAKRAGEFLASILANSSGIHGLFTSRLFRAIHTMEQIRSEVRHLLRESDEIQMDKKWNEMTDINKGVQVFSKIRQAYFHCDDAMEGETRNYIVVSHLNLLMTIHCILKEKPRNMWKHMIVSMTESALHGSVSRVIVVPRGGEMHASLDRDMTFYNRHLNVSELRTKTEQREVMYDMPTLESFELAILTTCDDWRKESKCSPYAYDGKVMVLMREFIERGEDVHRGSAIRCLPAKKVDDMEKASWWLQRITDMVGADLFERYVTHVCKSILARVESGETTESILD